MAPERNRSFAHYVLALGLGGVFGVCHATPLITLPAGEIARMNYTGQELFIDANHNGRPDAGDAFEGIVSISQIWGATSGADFSSQLADKEITSHFRFSVTGHSIDSSHLEFGLLPGDSFNLYVGQGSSRNFDPTAADAYARASDGQLWLGIQPGSFFESVNDRQPDGSPLNRAWADVSVNHTGYLLASDFLRTLLGRDAQHYIGGQAHNDHRVQAIFDDRIAGLSPYFPQFTYGIFGEFDVFPVPEPATWLLILIGVGLHQVLQKPRPCGKGDVSVISPVARLSAMGETQPARAASARCIVAGKADIGSEVHSYVVFSLDRPRQGADYRCRFHKFATGTIGTRHPRFISI
ncbi:MAG: hypothetical protein ACREUR_05810 [Nitrosospira sp.]